MNKHFSRLVSVENSETYNCMRNTIEKSIIIIATVHKKEHFSKISLAEPQEKTNNHLNSR